MKRVRKNSIFYKYLISYLFIFLIPTIVLTSLAYKNSVINLQNEIERSNLSNLIKIKDNVDANLKELQYMTLKMHFDNRLSRYMMTNNILQAQQGIEELSRYKVMNSFVDEIFFYFRGDDRIYTPNGVTDISTLVQTNYKFENWKEEEFYNDINTARFPSIRPLEKVNINRSDNAEVIAYMLPSPASGMEFTETVVYLIQKSKFSTMISDILGEFQGAVYILDKEGVTLVSVNNGGFVPTQNMTSNIPSLISSGPDGVYQQKMDNKSFSIVNVKSQNSNLNFMIVMPSDQFFKRVVEIRKILIGILILVLFFGIGIAITMSINNYRPVNKMLSQNRNLAEKINLQTPLVREQILQMLLRGENKNLGNLEQLIRDYSIIFNGPYYAVVVSSWNSQDNSDDTSENRHAFIKCAEVYLEEERNGYTVELIQEEMVVFLLNIGSVESPKTELERLISKIRNIYFRMFNCENAMGVGKIYDNVNDINRSFIEAMSAFEYRFVKGGKSVTYFEETLAAPKHIDWYPTEEKACFMQSLKQGDQILAIENLKSMMSAIRQRDISIPVTRYICYDVVNLLMKTLGELNYKGSSDVIENMMDYSSIDELERKIGVLVFDICEHINNNRSCKTSNTINEILLYINQNFKDYNLSLENIARHTGFSVYYISRFFKEQTGRNFTDYLAELRINEAKRLLCTTDYSIKDIAAEISYSDVPCFTRKFKAVEGIAPGKYRELFSEKKPIITD